MPAISKYLKENEAILRNDLEYMFEEYEHDKHDDTVRDTLGIVCNFVARSSKSLDEKDVCATLLRVCSEYR